MSEAAGAARGQGEPRDVFNPESFPFLLITAGIGAYWVAAGGGRVAMVGLALTFAGDVWRLGQRLARGTVPGAGRGPASVPVVPFLALGLVAHGALWRLLEIEPATRLVDGVRVAAGLYALGILWTGPLRTPRDIWRSILGLQAGAAQALLLGVPLSWLLRPTSLAAGRPEIAGPVALLACGAWILSAVRIQRGPQTRRRPLVATGAVILAGMLLAWTTYQAATLDAAPGGAAVRALLISCLALAAVGAINLWGAVPRRG
ncbi:MAG: hypothetical protein GF355_02430 [Candidatus Eisenbacteria bacterium]|nr:hypothetical protein [Candidatus Eisenbacteria bacterium]